ncbi:MAG TPA: VOC family protein [Dyella sp.]|uniref:VOC family protein n=1 Tax=Dyella sp. TaxID=1869338 RepID=UPI002F92E134
MRHRAFRQRAGILLTIVILAWGGIAAAATEPAGDRLDHILLWGRSIDQATAVMTAKLGFQVMPGRDPAGVANRYIRLSDTGFIELLGMTRPNPTLDPGMQADQNALHGGPGSRSFGIHSTALDAAQALLKQRGMAVTPVFSAAANDPDGLGPKAPPRWRLFALDPSPLSNHVFFIDYAARTDATSAMDLRTAREHPNGAQTLSAIWLLSAHAEDDKKQLAQMGFTDAKAVRLPQIAAHGYSVAIGPTHLLALEPDGNGLAADALQQGGPQILGVSVGVSDLDRAQRRIERGYEHSLVRYSGEFGKAFLAPTRDDLGLLIEFHAVNAVAR